MHLGFERIELFATFSACDTKISVSTRRYLARPAVHRCYLLLGNRRHPQRALPGLAWLEREDSNRARPSRQDLAGQAEGACPPAGPGIDRCRPRRSPPLTTSSPSRPGSKLSTPAPRYSAASGALGRSGPTQPSSPQAKDDCSRARRRRMTTPQAILCPAAAPACPAAPPLSRGGCAFQSRCAPFHSFSQGSA